MSASASMAALLVSRHPDRFKAVTMHSGVSPGTGAFNAVGDRGDVRPALDPAASSAAGRVRHGAAATDGYPGGADAVGAASNGRAAVRVWADAAGAKGGTGRTVRRGRRHSMQETDFKHRGVMMATLVEINGSCACHGAAAGLPSLSATATAPDASRMVWAFSAKQFARPV